MSKSNVRVGAQVRALAVLAGLLTLTVPTLAVANGLGNGSEKDKSLELATQKRYSGVITAVDAASMTIHGTKSAVTGRVDATKTKVFIDKRAATVADLKVTLNANAELGLDDVWSAIYVDSTR